MLPSIVLESIWFELMFLYQISSRNSAVYVEMNLVGASVIPRKNVALL